MLNFSGITYWFVLEQYQQHEVVRYAIDANGGNRAYQLPKGKTVRLAKTAAAMMAAPRGRKRKGEEPSAGDEGTVASPGEPIGSAVPKVSQSKQRSSVKRHKAAGKAEGAVQDDDKGGLVLENPEANENSKCSTIQTQ